MKRVLLYPIFIFLFLVLSGCSANYKEISSEPNFSQYIGQTYVLNENMSIRGINLPPGYGETVDVYMVGKLYEVEHKAPEEVTFTVFPKGSKFTITGAYECTNCLSFTKLRHVSIATEDIEKSVNVPITMPMHEIENKETVALVK